MARQTSSGMPQMGRAFAGWTSRITLTKRTEIVVDALVTYQDSQFVYNGTIQPLSPRQLNLKPEGQRSWEWLQIHCLATGVWDLKESDRIIWQGRIYKLMATWDYSLNGFIEYHLCRDYQTNNGYC